MKIPNHWPYKSWSWKNIRKTEKILEKPFYLFFENVLEFIISKFFLFLSFLLSVTYVI